MPYIKLLFVLLYYFLLRGEAQKREFKFQRVLEERLCEEKDCLFESSTESHVTCSIVCKMNENCLGFFYSQITKRCTGSNVTFGSESQFRMAIGFSFYQGQMLGMTPQPKPPEILSTTQMTSTSELTTLEIPPGWLARKGSSAYKIVFGSSFNDIEKNACKYQPASTNIAWIDDLEENRFIQELLIEIGVPAAFIGFLCDPNSEILVYTPTGGEVVFTEPLKQVVFHGWACVTLDTMGNWICNNCEEGFAAVCEKIVQ